MIPISDSARSQRFPIFNLIFIGINILAFFLQLTTMEPEGLINRYALIPSSINFADISTLYPFITAMFLHGGFLHIISNMLFLWVFGDNVEADLPVLFYPLLYLGAGIVGNLLQFWLNPQSDIPMLGASGAVAGVLGSYFMMFPKHKIRTLIFIPPFITTVQVSAFFMLGYWIIIQFVSGFGSLSGGMSQDGGVAYFAHIGGFIFGYVASLLIPKRGSGLVRIG